VRVTWSDVAVEAEPPDQEGELQLRGRRKRDEAGMLIWSCVPLGWFTAQGVVQRCRPR